MFCGGWIANDTRIYAQASGGIEEVACYHPIPAGGAVKEFRDWRRTNQAGIRETTTGRARDYCTKNHDYFRQ